MYGCAWIDNTSQLCDVRRCFTDAEFCEVQIPVRTEYSVVCFCRVQVQYSMKGNYATEGSLLPFPTGLIWQQLYRNKRKSNFLFVNRSETLSDDLLLCLQYMYKILTGCNEWNGSGG